MKKDNNNENQPIKIIPIMNPKEWGPSGWFFLHSIVSAYPEHPTESEKKHYESFFLSLGPVLPCILCRPHYMEYLQKHPLHKALDSRPALVQYFFQFHNNVNRRLGKPIQRKSSLSQYFYNSLTKTE